MRLVPSPVQGLDRKSTRLNSNHITISYAVFCLKKKKIVFTEGHLATRGDALIRGDLCDQAIRLARALAALLPGEPEVTGLLALLLLTYARRDARLTPDGEPVLLADQDRGRWDRAMIGEGEALVEQALRRNRPGPYQIQAAIAACHSGTAAAA